MRSITRLGLTLLLALPLLASTTATPASTQTPAVGARAARSTKLPWEAGGVRFVPNQIVVTLKDSASRSDVRALDNRLNAHVVSRAAGLNVDVVRVPPGTSVAVAVRRFERSPLVRFAEPDRIATPASNDTFFDRQWALNNTGQTHPITQYSGLSGTSRPGKDDADVDAAEAWEQTGVDPVVVAVIDTGVDVDHPDLVDRMWVNAGETPGNDTDDDANGFKDDVNGFDFKDHDGDPTPANGIDNSHGTHVAGIVAAEQDNATGVSGVCPNCEIMALRIGSANSLTLGAEVQAINYAIANGADIINLSLGSAIWAKSERAAIRKAGNRGILVVVAAGNSSLDNDIVFQHASGGTLDAWAPSFPASYTLSNILAVAASNDRDQYGWTSQCQTTGGIPLWTCGFTSWGHDSVDVAAPGVDILSTFKVGQGDFGPSPDYHVFDGTSMATPLVAGIAGLVRSEHPGFNPVQVKNAIMHSVEHPASLKLYVAWADRVHVGKTLLSGRFTRTHGRVNALDALNGSPTNATPKTDGNVDGARAIVTSKLGHLAWPADDNDVYKKRLAKGAKYRVVLDGPKGSDMDLWVWNPGTKEIFQFTAGCFFGGACPALRTVSAGRTADESVTFIANKAGVYYLQVNGWYKGGNYKLTVKRI
jgi:subtilisin family serine protease